MKTMNMAVVIGIFASACLVVGCQTARSGQAIYREDMTYLNQNMAPRIPVRTPSGEVTTLDKLTGPIYLVAFVGEGQGSSALRVAEELDLYDVAVVAVTGSDEEIPADADNVIRLSDPNGMVRTAYRGAAPGRLFLVDRFGYICMRGKLGSPEAVLGMAKRLGDQWDEDEWEDFYDTDTAVE